MATRDTLQEMEDIIPTSGDHGPDASSPSHRVDDWQSEINAKIWTRSDLYSAPRTAPSSSASLNAASGGSKPNMPCASRARN